MNEAIRVAMISLGCARNLVDSEVLLGHAVEQGFLIARDPKDADVVVVNTCGFVESAKQESIDTILEVCKLKEKGSLKGVVAVGCLVQRYAEELQKELPEVDALFTISDYSNVPAVIRKIVNGSERRWVPTVDGGKPKTAKSDQLRVLLTPKSYAYLRISEGCDHTCTFCAIPKMRGRNRSKPMEILVKETANLAAQGVKEIVVVAEDSTHYGLDIYKKRVLHELVAQIAAVNGVEWVRIMYAYPHTVSADLTRVMRENAKVVPYLDIPIQHVSGPMLKAMKRGVSREQVAEILWRLREEVPGIVVRSTLISGFPGETEHDHAEVLDFVEKYKFERLGVFTYSPEEGTPAVDLPNHVSPKVAEKRRGEIMMLQQKIMREGNEKLVGTTQQVLVDGLSEDGKSWVARTKGDAPEIDAIVRLDLASKKKLQSGDLLDVTISSVLGYDLVATVR